DGPAAVHSREHVLFRCEHYTRRHQHLLNSLDPFYDIQQFLTDNPTAMSFEDLPEE
ncbi:hypothetical protein GY45DRAFT_1254633, partial [Cubamyces sp. BRFM 1775]